MGEGSVSVVGIIERDELENRRYRGMNPAFVRSVWAKRRRLEPRPVEAPKPERVKIKLPPVESFRLERIQRQIAEGGIKGIIAQVAMDHGVPYEDIIGVCRTKRIVAARHAAIVEVATRRPSLSLNQMGRVFKRDHTTIVHVLQKYQIRPRQS